MYPLLWTDLLKSEALQCFLKMSKLCPWLVSEMRSRPGHPFCKTGKGGKVISPWLHSQLVAKPRTEIALWIAKSATSTWALCLLPSTALPLVLLAKRSPNHELQILARGLEFGSIQAHVLLHRNTTRFFFCSRWEKRPFFKCILQIQMQ